MNAYASAHSLKYKMPLAFTVGIQLVSVRLRSPRPVSLSFEFTNAKTIVMSRNFHKVEPNAYETVLRETVDMPLVVMYDPRKARFMPQTIDFSVLSNHGGFSKKMASGAINVSPILNSQTLAFREQIKLDKCFDKNAALNIKTVFVFVGAQNEGEALSHTKFSGSAIR